MGNDYSFSEVNESASKFASALIKLGVEKGDRVGIFMPNIPQFVIAFFGILKIGATVVPISPLYGTEDILNTITDSKIKAIVGLDFLYPSVIEACKNSKAPEIVILTSLSDLVSPILGFIAKLVGKIPKAPKIPHALKFYDLIDAHEPMKESVTVVPKNDLAVIGYTGGTTGTPKGAMLTHYNLVTNLIMANEWSIMKHPKGIHKKFMGAVPFFHIIGLTAVMLVAAYYESTIYLAPNPRDFEGLLKIIEKYKVQYFHGVPTLFRAILNLPKFDKYDLSSLEIIFSGSAPLPKEIATTLEEKIGCLMIEAYGMTETSPMVAANPFEKDNRKLGSIGIPFPDTDIKIVDEKTGEDLAIGEIGEIIVKGPQVMKGYLNKPEETENTIKNGYIFTGDIGYMDQDGFLFISSRKKDMVNVSGYKVFPNELEKLLKENFDQVDESAVIAVPDDYSGEAVKLIVVLKEAAQLSESRILDFFKGKVAKYKVPKIIEFRSELPKTMVGKIDRKILRAELEQK
jgi:long-chain acyl-CoA synthetase